MRLRRCQDEAKGTNSKAILPHPWPYLGLVEMTPIDVYCFIIRTIRPQSPLSDELTSP